MIVSDGFGNGNMCSSHCRRSSIFLVTISWSSGYTGICPCRIGVEHTGRKSFIMKARRSTRRSPQQPDDARVSAPSPPHRNPHFLIYTTSSGNIGGWRSSGLQRRQHGPRSTLGADRQLWNTPALFCVTSSRNTRARKLELMLVNAIGWANTLCK